MNIHIDGARHRDDAERTIHAFISELVTIRRDLHQYPELSFHEGGPQASSPNIFCPTVTR